MSETDQVPDAPKVKVWLSCIADTLEVRIMESEDELDDYLRDNGTIGATEALKVVADYINALNREKAEELLPTTDASTFFEHGPILTAPPFEEILDRTEFQYQNTPDVSQTARKLLLVTCILRPNVRPAWQTVFWVTWSRS